MDTLLIMKDICKSFFGVPANDHVTLEIKKGEIHALLGENGAGKTTLMNILYGIYQPDAGEIFWKGKNVTFSAPKDAIKCRIGMVHQHFTLVPKLTVSENITLGLKSKGYPFTDRIYLDNQIKAISEKYGLVVDPSQKLAPLSVGVQQRVEILKLLYRNVELLILDEPTAVLTPGEIGDLFKVLRKLKEDGKSTIIITHRIHEVMEISDRVTILRDGKCIATTPTSSLTDEGLSEYMIGRQLNVVERTPSPYPRGESLSIRNLTLEEKGKKLLDDITLDIASGEVLGIAGVDGNGQKQLAETIVGIRRSTKGNILLEHKEISSLDVDKRKQLGIAYISDDRQHDGLVMDMSLSENMLLRSNRRPFMRHGFLRQKEIDTETGKAIKDYAIKAFSVEEPVRLLSGGNQQKLILARELCEGVKLIIAFQPTRGLDIGASEFVREMLLSYRDKGCCILLISADLEELFSISDKVAVLHGGKIMGERKNDASVNMTEIGLMMAGKQSKTECKK